MPSRTPFRPDQAKDALPQGEGDYVLPICLPGPTVMMGEDMAVLVLETIEGQRVDVPMGMRALSDLRGAVTEALGMLQAVDQGEVQ